jgi:hypothetical protein
MGQISDACARPAEATAEDQQARVKLDMSRHELGELEKNSGRRWNGRPSRASATSRRCRLKSRVCGRKWMPQGGAQRRSRREKALRRAKEDAILCTQVRV